LVESTPSPSTLGEGGGECLRETNRTEDPLPYPPPDYRGREKWIAAHASAAAMGLAILAKGPPAGFVILFLMLLAAIERQWKKPWQWILTGAPLTLTVIALPWFVYIHSLPEWPIVREELKVIVSGEEHRGWFFMYFPQS